VLDRSPFGSIRWQCVRSMIGRAGLTRWPRLWHNLRASRQTDLVARFPLHTVSEWLGNTPSVATRHYLTVRPEDFAAAVAEHWGGRKGWCGTP
jgi:hypothetical protein